MAAFRQNDATVTRPPASRRALAFALVIVPLLLLIAGEAARSETLSAFAGSVLCAEAFLFFMWPALAPSWSSGGVRVVKGALEVDRDALRLDGEVLLDRRDIQNVSVEPLPSGTIRVWFGGPRPDADVAVDLASEERVDALLAAAGLEGRRVARFRVAPLAPRTSAERWRATAANVLGVLAMVGISVALASRAPVLGLAVLPLLLVYSLVSQYRARRPTTDLAVGADGIVVGRPGSHLAVDLASIRGVRRDGEDAAVLDLEKDAPLRFRFGDDERGVRARETFVERMRDALTAFRRDLHDIPLATMLARGDRDDASWRRALTELAQANGSYRVAEVPDDQLLAIAASPSTEASARVGAVVALRERPREEGTKRVLDERLRVLAEQTTHAEVRVALERAVDGRDADDVLRAVSPQRGRG